MEVIEFFFTSFWRWSGLLLLVLAFRPVRISLSFKGKPWIKETTHPENRSCQ